jgi:hypothetical protein
MAPTVIHWIVRLSPALVLAAWAITLTASVVFLILLTMAIVASEVERIDADG